MAPSSARRRNNITAIPSIKPTTPVPKQLTTVPNHPVSTKTEAPTSTRRENHRYSTTQDDKEATTMAMSTSKRKSTRVRLDSFQSRIKETSSTDEQTTVTLKRKIVP